MIFKRRDKLPFWQSVGQAILPKRGWLRAFSYVGLRLRRLPDSPHKIALGVAIGVWVSFTPFFGFHILLAIAVALAIGGNAIAAALGTFFGTPPTYILIAAINFRIGNWILGVPEVAGQSASVLTVFGQAFSELWQNFLAVFSSATVDWSHLIEFSHRVALPYAVGGIIPSLITGLAAYFCVRPIIFAYQNRRKGRLLARLKERRANLKTGADGKR